MPKRATEFFKTKVIEAITEVVGSEGFVKLKETTRLLQKQGKYGIYKNIYQSYYRGWSFASLKSNINRTDELTETQREELIDELQYLWQEDPDIVAELVNNRNARNKTDTDRYARRKATTGYGRPSRRNSKAPPQRKRARRTKPKPKANPKYRTTVRTKNDQASAPVLSESLPPLPVPFSCADLPRPPLAGASAPKGRTDAPDAYIEPFPDLFEPTDHHKRQTEPPSVPRRDYVQESLTLKKDVDQALHQGKQLSGDYLEAYIAHLNFLIQQNTATKSNFLIEKARILLLLQDVPGARAALIQGMAVKENRPLQQIRVNSTSIWTRFFRLYRSLNKLVQLDINSLITFCNQLFNDQSDGNRLSPNSKLYLSCWLIITVGPTAISLDSYKTFLLRVPIAQLPYTATLQLMQSAFTCLGDTARAQQCQQRIIELSATAQSQQPIGPKPQQASGFKRRIQHQEGNPRPTKRQRTGDHGGAYPATMTRLTQPPTIFARRPPPPSSLPYPRTGAPAAAGVGVPAPGHSSARPPSLSQSYGQMGQSSFRMFQQGGHDISGASVRSSSSRGKRSNASRQPADPFKHFRN